MGVLSRVSQEPTQSIRDEMFCSSSVIWASLAAVASTSSPSTCSAYWGLCSALSSGACCCSSNTPCSPTSA